MANLPSNITSIIYPDPPLFVEESELLKSFIGNNKNISTLITTDNEAFKDTIVGISVADCGDLRELAVKGLNKDVLDLVVNTMTAYVMNTNGTLVYGGDFRKDGFTIKMLDEAENIYRRKSLFAENRKDTIRLINFYPAYKKEEIEKNSELTAKYANVLEIRYGNAQVPSYDEFIRNIFDNNEDAAIKACHLTQMRKDMIDACDIRICVGGKRRGYSGIMPGVLEEILIAIEKQKAIYMLGGFGGLTADVCQLRAGQMTKEEAINKWIQNRFIDTEKISDFFTKQIDTILAADLRNGLSSEDNQKLYETVYVEEAIHLIFKGIKNYKEKKNSLCNRVLDTYDGGK